MKFYRGDSLPNLGRNVKSEDRGRTFADYFCGHGLMAKFAEGGSSDLLQGKTLFDRVISHVGYKRGQSEQKLAYRSPFLSFTEDLNEAINFADRSRKKNLEECYLEDASYFVWELDIDLPEEEEPGYYKFAYKASSANCIDFVNRQIHRGETGDMHNFAKGIMSWIVMLHADNDPRDHFAELIDVVKYVRHRLSNNVNPHLAGRTLERAQRSKEWLLYPTDPMEDGVGISSRFIMNQHLRVYRCYRVATS